MQLSYRPDPEESSPRFYVAVRIKFAVAAAFAALWVSFSVWLALPWIRDTAGYIALPASIVLITLLAFIPGALVSFLLASLVLDRQPPLTVEHPTVGVTVVVAARNEAAGIGETVDYLAEQDYDGLYRVILVDNGSTDHTAAIALERAEAVGLDLSVLTETTPGKNNALNTGLAAVETPLVITVDADTLLHHSLPRHGLRAGLGARPRPGLLRLLLAGGADDHRGGPAHRVGVCLLVPAAVARRVQAPGAACAQECAGPGRLPLRVPDPDVGGVGARVCAGAVRPQPEMEVRRIILPS